MVDYEEYYDLHEQHALLLRILKNFDALCKENEVHYSLSDGTLLGAARHDGFIPWDDDADIMMTREEYKKLLALSPNGSDVQIIKTTFCDRISITQDNPKCAYVDLFVLDRKPSSNATYQFKKLLSKILRCYYVNSKQLRNAWKSPQLINRVIKTVGYSIAFLVGRIEHIFFSSLSITKVHDNLVSTEQSHASSEYVRMTDSLEMMKYRYPMEWFDAYENITFAGNELSVICEYDNYLTYSYGKYMALPPETTRHPENHLTLSDDEKALKYSVVIKDFRK